MENKEEIINTVIRQIIDDVESGDVTAIEEFLRLVYNKRNKPLFVAYLDEDGIQKLGYDPNNISL